MLMESWETLQQKTGYSIHRIYIFEQICKYYTSQLIHIQHKDRLIKIGEILLHISLADCLPYEKVHILFEMTRVLRNSQIQVDDNSLLFYIKNGQINFSFGNELMLPSSARRHWIVRLLTPFFPVGTKRRKLASKIYQAIKRQIKREKKSCTVLFIFQCGRTVE